MPTQPVSSNHTYLVGACIAPFLDRAVFPSEGGFIDGRLCATISGLPGRPSCCLPCPVSEWVYSESFNTYSVVSEWLNVVGIVLLSFMLLSYLVLPAQKTRSHYLSVCLVVAVMMIHLGYTIPLGAKPEQCFNEITPNDMYSSLECGWSGGFILAGGLTATMWIFIRALSMNLQICWDIIPGQKFFYVSQALGWGVPAAIFAACMTATGVSFRFGSACHVNHENSMADFWGPLMAIAGAAGLFQAATFIYCMKVYLKNLWSDGPAIITSTSASVLPSHNSSLRHRTARAVYQRLKKVLWLQWRGMAIVTFVLVDVVFFVVVFVTLDGTQARVVTDITRLEPWLACLVFKPKEQCLPLVRGWLINEPMTIAVLFLLGLTGIQIFLFLTRPSIFPAWLDFFRRRFGKRQDFVSLDARTEDGAPVMRTLSKSGMLRMERGYQTTTFEMQRPSYSSIASEREDFRTDTKSPDPKLAAVLPSPSSPSESYRSPLHMDRATEGTYGHERRSPALVGGNTPPSMGTTYTFPRQPFPDTHSRPSQQYQYVNSNGYFPPHVPQTQSRSRSRNTRSPSRNGFDPTPTTGGRVSPIERGQTPERQYRPPGSSFSTPKTPSRQSSLRDTDYDPREAWSAAGRGGQVLHPPSEAGESIESEDLYYDRRLEDLR